MGVIVTPKVNILGIGISTITMNDALKQIETWIDNRDRLYVSVCTVHTVMECQKSEAMRQAINGAGMATPDGMPLVWLGKLQSSHPVNRVYGPDLMLALCELSAQKGYTQYFYGGAEGVSEKLSQTLSRRYPALKVVGAYSPPFRPLTDAEDQQIIHQINQANPDIIWVGLGTPKQDLWMASHRNLLDAAVIIAVGAAFDFHTGRIPQAPSWMQQVGLEWLYRLVQEPKRLWYRYLVYNPLFVLNVLAQLLGIRRYTLE